MDSIPASRPTEKRAPRSCRSEFTRLPTWEPLDSRWPVVSREMHNLLVGFWVVVSSLLSGLPLCPIAQADHLELVVGEEGGNSGAGQPAARGPFFAPFGIDFDRQGDMFIVELEGGRVHHWNRHRGVTTIAGNGEKGDRGDGGPAANAVFHSMHAVAIDPSGDLLIADTLNHRVRRLDPRRAVVEPFAGTGASGNSGDGGPAQQANFHGVYCVALTPDYATLLITDLENRRIRAVEVKTGQLRLIAGNGERGIPRDGSLATASPLVDPRAAAADRFGNIYILERGGHALRVVDPRGRIRTVAGTGAPGRGGDGGPALEAKLRGPKHLCVTVDGRVVIADTDNHQIRMYDPETGRIERIAGSGQQGSQGLGGPAELAELHFPHGVCLDSSGELYIVDTGNNRILKLVRDRKAGRL